jgi:phosphoribosylformimino-5-aminoimidazole carboxamide ribotide isomerase
VKQIVGSTLGNGNGDGEPHTNFISDRPASHFARLYERDELAGGHIIMLGSGSEGAATAALAGYPGGMQIGGGITPEIGAHWIERGASGVIVTSYLFVEGRFDRGRLEAMEESVSHKRLILDLSCAPSPDRGGFVVATDRWRHLTDFAIDAANLEQLAEYCSEFLIHATQVEGKRGGIDADLVSLLGDITPVPTTYAGGIRDMDDIDQIGQLGQGRLDYTVGSALDIFGGKGLMYEDLVALNRQQPGAYPSNPSTSDTD